MAIKGLEKKTRRRVTLNLLTNADSSTNTMILSCSFFFLRGSKKNFWKRKRVFWIVTDRNTDTQTDFATPWLNYPLGRFSEKQFAVIIGKFLVFGKEQQFVVISIKSLLFFLSLQNSHKFFWHFQWENSIFSYNVSKVLYKYKIPSQILDNFLSKSSAKSNVNWPWIIYGSFGHLPPFTTSLPFSGHNLTSHDPWLTFRDATQKC